MVTIDTRSNRIAIHNWRIVLLLKSRMLGAGLKTQQTLSME